MSDNLALWQSVAKTDPSHTKKVNQRGGFTAISAHYQVMRATETFGPIGKGWGYINGEAIFHENLVIVPVSLWYLSDGVRCEFGPVYGGAEWKNGQRIDSDAPKKASTDGLTKALSHLGFNADVFLGLFDDNKYVDAMRREFSGEKDNTQHEARAEQKRNEDGDPILPNGAKLEGAHSSLSALKAALKNLAHDIGECADSDTLECMLIRSDVYETIKQGDHYLPSWMMNGIKSQSQFVPLHKRISDLRDQFRINDNTYVKHTTAG